jgi:hypothetical protein
VPAKLLDVCFTPESGHSVSYEIPLVLGQKSSRDLLRLRSANAKCLLTLPHSLRNSRHPSRMRLAIWIVGLTALATSLDSTYGGFYGRAIARMLTDMANGVGLG